MGGEYMAGGNVHPFAYTDGPWQNQPWVNIGSGQATALSDGSFSVPYDSYMAQSRGQGYADTGQGALMPQINSVLGGGLGGGMGGGQPFLGSIPPPQRAPMAAPPPMQSAPIPGGAAGNQLANMQAMFGQGGGGGAPMGGGLLGQPRTNPMRTVQMGFGPRSAPYTRGLL